jgi:hypothetical protein
MIVFALVFAQGVCNSGSMCASELYVRTRLRTASLYLSAASTLAAMVAFFSLLARGDR